MSNIGFNVSFATTTPESVELGEHDSIGWWLPGNWRFDVSDMPAELAFEFDQDYYDPDEHDSMDDAIIAWAVQTLNDNGAIHASSSIPDSNMWWMTEADTTDYSTGESIELAFHFVGFTDEQIERIHITQRNTP